MELCQRGSWRTLYKVTKQGRNKASMDLSWIVSPKIYMFGLRSSIQFRATWRFCCPCCFWGVVYFQKLGWEKERNVRKSELRAGEAANYRKRTICTVRCQCERQSVCHVDVDVTWLSPNSARNCASLSLRNWDSREDGRLELLPLGSSWLVGL